MLEIHGALLHVQIAMLGIHEAMFGAQVIMFDIHGLFTRH
jgi:hypothetical protein